MGGRVVECQLSSEVDVFGSEMGDGRVELGDCSRQRAQLTLQLLYVALEEGEGLGRSTSGPTLQV